MQRIHLYVFAFLFILSACSPSAGLLETLTPSPAPLFEVPEPTATPALEPTMLVPTATPISSVSLHRGVNMGNMLESPNEGDWGTFVQKKYFEAIKQAGFDFVRLPVAWHSHAGYSTPYTIDPAFFLRVDQVVGWALQSDLKIILELHSYTDMTSDPWGNEERFNAIWKQIAEHYKSYPASLLFELLNEPSDQINASMWNSYFRETLLVIRATNPTRDVVLGPVNWSTYDWVSTLDVPQDPHIIVTFHYYSPFEFTHQGAEWVEGSKAWLGTTWEGTVDDRAEITANFDSVADWARRRHVRILLGEFGAYSKAEMPSRVRWTEYVRSEAERHDFAWSYWEFNAGFGVYDPNANVWREDLLRALIP
jgi:endoglucanase